VSNEDKDGLDDDFDAAKPASHNWNHREHRKPISWYAVLIAICVGIAWILSSMGYG